MHARIEVQCRKFWVMPEFLDPIQPGEIAIAMQNLIYAADLRTHKANKAYLLGRAYSWHRCAKETFEFIVVVAAKYKALRAV